MKKLLISAAVAALLAATSPVLAQQDEHHGGARGAGPEHGEAGAHVTHGGPAMARPQTAPATRQQEDRRPSAGAHAAPGARPAPVNHLAPGTVPARPTDNHANDRGRPGGPGMSGPRPGNSFGRDRNNDRRGGGHSNYGSYQRNFNAPHRYHAPTYRRPSGWYAHRWTYGELLPSIFWAQDYWLNDYNDYGLMAPPPGTVWIRDGNDAILIDRSTGEVIQVEYDAFY